MPEYSVVIPTYKEAENIKILIPQICNFFKEKNLDFEIIIVNDSPMDETQSIVKSFQEKYKNIILIQRARKTGIGSALREGYNSATGKFLLSMDADLAFRIEEIGKFLVEKQKGYDLVIGSKYLKDSTYTKNSFLAVFRGFISEMGNIYMGAVTSIPIKDFTLNFRLIDKKLWKSINPIDDQNFFFVEMIVQAHKKNFKIKEIPISFLPRKFGKSKTKIWQQTWKFFYKTTKILLYK